MVFNHDHNENDYKMYNVFITIYSDVWMVEYYLSWYIQTHYPEAQLSKVGWLWVFVDTIKRWNMIVCFQKIGQLMTCHHVEGQISSYCQMPIHHTSCDHQDQEMGRHTISAYIFMSLKYNHTLIKVYDYMGIL